jgi:hypothetical protein
MEFYFRNVREEEVVKWADGFTFEQKAFEDV